MGMRNYYVRMSKDAVWAHHERFSLGFCFLELAALSGWYCTECRHHSKPRKKRLMVGPNDVFRQAPTAVGGTPEDTFTR